MICFKKVTKQLDDYKSVKELYFSAFPAVERAPFWLLMKKSKNDCADFYAIYDEEKWIGLIYAITDGEVVYVFYYAISEKERGHGIGVTVLDEFKNLYNGKKIFLAIEQIEEENVPNPKQRMSRYKFYQRCGFSRQNAKIVEAKVTFDVMTYGGEINPESYNKMMKKYLGKIMSHFIKTEMKCEGKYFEQ